jgi:hypothetical protein
MNYNYAQIEALHSAARRERSAYVHCLIERAILWVRSLVGAQPQLGSEACC